MAANPYLYHLLPRVHEQARGVSSYVSTMGNSSMSEIVTTTGWSFLGLGNQETKVSSRKYNTQPMNVR